MSFELPRRPVSLRFTGALKALGQERPKAPPPSSARSVPPPPSRRAPQSADVYIQEAQPTPYVGSRPSERAERAALPTMGATDPKVATVRGRLASFDDDVQTLALDRDDLFGGVVPKAAAKPPGPNLPVPGFRSAEQLQLGSDPTFVVRPKKPASSGLSVTAWLCIAVIAAAVSYSFAPDAASGLEEAVRALAGR